MGKQAAAPPADGPIAPPAKQFWQTLVGRAKAAQVERTRAEQPALPRGHLATSSLASQVADLQTQSRNQQRELEETRSHMQRMHEALQRLGVSDAQVERGGGLECGGANVAAEATAAPAPTLRTKDDDWQERTRHDIFGSRKDGGQTEDFQS